MWLNGCQPGARLVAASSPLRSRYHRRVYKAALRLRVRHAWDGNAPCGAARAVWIRDWHRRVFRDRRCSDWAHGHILRYPSRGWRWCYLWQYHPEDSDGACRRTLPDRRPRPAPTADLPQWQRSIGASIACPLPCQSDWLSGAPPDRRRAGRCGWSPALGPEPAGVAGKTAASATLRDLPALQRRRSPRRIRPDGPAADGGRRRQRFLLPYAQRSLAAGKDPTITTAILVLTFKFPSATFHQRA